MRVSSYYIVVKPGVSRGNRIRFQKSPQWMEA